jgi:predicted regulator of Ras-like GTPase activity (Roadblock/LC7/MglB family)
MQTELTQGFYKLRSGAAVMPEQHQAFERLLTEAITQIPANFVFLVDVAGQIVVAKGNYEDVNLIMLGSLVAGDLAASQEIARLTGQYHDNQVVLREGENVNTFIIEAGHYLALLVQVDHVVPLGWARVVIKRIGQSLAKVMEEEGMGVLATAVNAEPIFTFEDTEDELSDLFSEALDDLWGDLSDAH